jgi:type IV pilus assembly protein PilB
MTPHRIPPRHKRIGEILVAKGLITPDQLACAMGKQKENGKPLGQTLLEQDLLSPEKLKAVLAEQAGIPHIWLRKGMVDPAVVRLLPKEKALHYKVIPMFCVNGVLTLASPDPDAILIFDDIARITGKIIQPVICRSEDIIEAIGFYYQEQLSVSDMMDDIDTSCIEVVQRASEEDISELASMADGSPVVNLTNKILLRAIRDGASDIHLEPFVDVFRVRVRIDGVLYEMMSPRSEMHPAVVSRLKVMANLDIAERRMPQDGRIRVDADGQLVDLRFSSMPSIHGEKVVLRILDRRRVILDINRLGFESALLERFKALVRHAYGLILVCGPTGSGKTTTLYSAITLLNSIDKNIITIEDPVEYQLEGIIQNQVNPAIGLKFSTFLKHALRQDPDILLVGEIRDRETAEIAVQASLTGHLVLSTIHTTDSPSTITRLLEMGVAPYLISSALLAVLAQRLVRRICPECKTDYYPPQAVLEGLGVDPQRKLRLMRGRGCPNCYDSGFKGRTGIHEVLEINESLQRMILTNPSLEQLRRQIEKNGFRSLIADGYEKVLSGITTVEEVQRASHQVL